MDYNLERFEQQFNHWFSEKESEIKRNLINLINIDTSTPHESDCFVILKEMLTPLGFDVEFESTHPQLHKHPSFSPHILSDMTVNRGNLRAQNKSIKSKKNVLFNCHIDVVPGSDDFENAFCGYEEDGKIYGRGACDTKNNAIMLIEAIRFLISNNIPFSRRPFIDFVIEEEIGGNGTLSTILHGTEAEEVICLEPTSLEVFRGHRGCITFQVEITGKSVHMGGDDTGINAIEWAYEIIKKLKELEHTMLTEAVSDTGFSIWNRPLQLNIGKISGGEWSGSVPEKCVITCDLGFLPKYSLSDVKNMIESTCRSIDNEWVSKHLRFEFNGLQNDAYIIDSDFPVVYDLVKMVNLAGIRQNQSYGWKVSCDARYYAKDAELPVVIFGSGDLENAHSAHEYVSLKQLKKGCFILAGFLSGLYEGETL